jgi:hypothetical protein
MLSKFFRPILGAALAVALTASVGLAASLAANQTLGFGASKLLTFTYGQNFSCIHQPTDDLNFNGILADADPGEFQMPICQVATEPTIGPTGAKIKNVAHIYVLVPMFSVDNDQNSADAISCANQPAGTVCGTALGDFLKTAFGFVPEGFKATPLVTTQCPDPGLPPGTCTMHTSRLDLAPALAALGKIPAPATANIFTPTPNHSHVIDNDLINHKNPIWWEVRPVLVMDQADWPAADGSSGITSVKKMDAAEKAGNAVEVPSNFFLFFGSMKNMNM